MRAQRFVLGIVLGIEKVIEVGIEPVGVEALVGRSGNIFCMSI